MKNRKFVINPLTGAGINAAIRGVEEYQQWLKEKSEQLNARLASLGATSVSLGFARAIYTGPRDYQITVERRGENRWAVMADGEMVLFAEFGSGVTYGEGHPEAAKHGMGPGTYPIPPGKGHWNDPNGWYLPKEKGGGHTFGNPPNAPMYNAVKQLEQELANIVREVFDGD